MTTYSRRPVVETSDRVYPRTFITDHTLGGGGAADGDSHYCLRPPIVTDSTRPPVPRLSARDVHKTRQEGSDR